MNSVYGAKYTMRLDEVIAYQGRPTVESWFKDYELTDYLTAEEVAVINQRKVWNKDKLARLIVDHYLMSEIGSETIGLFRHRARTYMKELMEYYALVIYSASIKYDPMVNVDFTETYQYNRTSSDTTSETGSNTSQGSTSGSGLTVNSDTPQGQINKTQILQGKYATSTGTDESTSSTNASTNTTNNSTSNGSLNDTYTKHQKGNSGVLTTAQKLIEQYRDLITTTNRNIIEDLNILFMGIY